MGTSIELDVEVAIVAVDSDGYIVTPDDTAGYWALSSPLDEDGNTVIVGHNRAEPLQIFANLSLVETGDGITVTDQFGREYHFLVTEVVVIQVEGASPAEANRTAEYVQSTDTRRLTLITCDPSPTCPNRLVVVATPVDE